MPTQIERAIVKEFKWDCPSRIQCRLIPSISSPDAETGQYDNLVAQARNGQGMSSGCVIGSLMRVDKNLPQVQVIYISHTRVIANQIANLFKKAACFSPEYSICNLTKSKLDPKSQIIVSTFDKLFEYLEEKYSFDMSQLRVFVIDEVDAFFYE